MLALNGGEPLVDFEFSPHVMVGSEEKEACNRVLDSGCLSGFYGSDGEFFNGGPEVKAFEKEWSDFFKVKCSVSVNSNTSGLICALGAAGVGPGDQVIVSPWTMCASATSILVWNAIPVFADIEPETFNLDVEKVAALINEKTKAIVVPDIFGHPAELDKLMELAAKHNLVVVEDAAQAPGGKFHDKFVGTVGHIGVFSLNYHKHIHSGEGGVCVTNDEALAEKMRLIRNHAEAVVSERGGNEMVNMVGFNFRMTELQAAIAREQLKKLPRILETKQKDAEYLINNLSGLKGLKMPVVKENCTHCYYMFPMILSDELEAKRSRIVEALRAEGLLFVCQGYANVHLLAMYQQRKAYGNDGYPWSAYDPEGAVSYQKGICPVAEKLHDHSFISMEHCLYQYNERDLEAIVQVFKKVWAHLDEL